MSLADSQYLVSLQAQSPPRMSQTIINGSRGILCEVRSVHRLQIEVRKIESYKALRVSACLRVDELQLVAPQDAQRGTRLGTDGQP